ncbi:MAG: beta-mannosidase [Clostridia bacterium]|nr:beta-mannosidase [Clostridia bacterium]
MKGRLVSRYLRRLLPGLLCAALLPVCAVGEEEAVLRVEAESGIFTGAVFAASDGESGWAEGFRGEGDGVEMTVAVEAEGFYDIRLILASADGGHKENPVLLDGVSIGQAACDGKGFRPSVLRRVFFSAGEHRLSLGTGWGWIRADAAELVPSDPLPEDLYRIDPVLSVPDPSPEARNLFRWLCECYGKKIITGQFCDGGMYGLENQAVWRATGGSYPAILGLDMIDYTPSRVERGGAGKAVDHALEYWDKGGIVDFCWHWNAPSPYLQADRWYSGFYTEYTTFNLKKVMDGEDEAGYALLIRDIDAVAEQLAILRDAGVPVLWRPLHEASGGWFWWGASGPEPYLRLWNLLYDRLTNVHGLNNLIWIWNGQDKAWYPGDATVDIIGEDIYPGERVYSSQSPVFMDCLDYTEGRKMIILSENGCVPDPDLVFRDGTVWGSYCTWGGDFVLKSAKFNRPSERYTEVAMLRKMYGDERAVTRADIPDLKGTN